MAANSLNSPNIPAVPIRTIFGAPKGSPADSGSGVSWTWIKFFQAFEQAVLNQVAAIIGLTIVTVTQANLPVTLSMKDAGLVYNVSDYNHLLEWNGTGFVWAAGEIGSGYISSFLSAPTSVGWHLCDGSVVSRLNSDGTVSSVTLPNYATAAYLKLGTSAIPGPTAAGGSTEAVSAGTPAGTVSAPTFTGGTDTTSTEDSDVNVQGGTADTPVANAGHTHTVTPTGTVSAPTFTGSPLGTHLHGPGNLELDNTQLLAFYRT